jgi:hypothetical protein
MERLGGLYWVRRTDGSLSRADRWRLLGKVAASIVPTLVKRLRLQPFPTIDDAAFAPPDSRLGREAVEALDDLGAGSEAIIGHSYRAWMFGLALAHLDKAQSLLDPESFFCAALLHDLGLISPTPGRDFTRAGADCALKCATAASVPNDLAEIIADAICVHPTPGISVRRDGALGYYVQWGSIVDVSGVCRTQIAPRNLDYILRLHPPGDAFNETLSVMVRKEAAAVPAGRFALLVKYHVMH